MDPYQDLANGIVLQAVKDYRKALKNLKRNPQNHAARDTKDEVERFFHSAWYRALTSVDADWLLRELQKEES